MTDSWWNKKWELREVMCLLMTLCVYIVAYICSIVFSKDIEHNLVYMVPLFCFLLAYVHTYVTEIIYKHKDNKLICIINTAMLCSLVIMLLSVVSILHISIDLCNTITIACCGINVVVSALWAIMAIVYVVKRYRIAISISEVTNYALIWYFPFVINSIIIKM